MLQNSLLLQQPVNAGVSEDTIEIRNSTLTSFADYQALATNLGTVINGNLLQNANCGVILTLNYGAANQTNIWLLGLTANALTAADFNFIV